MARIRQDDIETVRERTDIIALVQQFVGLKKAGRSYTGLCPFHTEKTPSFTVDPGKQVYYCFGCGVGGNAYHFLMAVENLTFPEAVERLAGQSGIQLHYEGVSADERRASARRQALFHANEEAATLYHEHLLGASEAADARHYLSGRGISKESVEEFRIGFSPDRSDFLLRRLARKFSPDILIEAGLALKDGRGSVRDRFRGRVMFPVHSLSGQAVGFGARLLKGEGPKYLNSPETPVYRKGEMLYNLHRAKAEVTSTNEAFVVEGYTDVIGLHQGGLSTGVATCGTALGEGHFRLLARFAKRVVLAFDSDEAGARAAERAYEFFEQYPVEALVLVLPEGSDPADIALDKGVDEFRELASGAVPLVEYMIRRRLQSHDLEGPEGQTRAVQDALPIVAGLGDPVRRERYSGMLADLTGVSASTVLLELDRPVPGERAHSRASRPAPARKEPRSPEREVEKEALKLLVQQADTAEEYMTQIGDDHFSTERARKVLGFLREGRGSVPDLVERARERGLGEAIAELAVEAPKGDPASGYTERVFSRLQEFFLTRQITTMKKRLERLNPTKDPNAYDALFGELMALEGERRSVRARAGEGA